MTYDVDTWHRICTSVVHEQWTDIEEWEVINGNLYLTQKDNRMAFYAKKYLVKFEVIASD